MDLDLETNWQRVLSLMDSSKAKQRRAMVLRLAELMSEIEDRDPDAAEAALVRAGARFDSLDQRPSLDAVLEIMLEILTAEVAR